METSATQKDLQNAKKQREPEELLLRLAERNYKNQLKLVEALPFYENIVYIIFVDYGIEKTKFAVGPFLHELNAKRVAERFFWHQYTLFKLKLGEDLIIPAEVYAKWSIHHCWLRGGEKGSGVVTNYKEVDKIVCHPENNNDNSSETGYYKITLYNDPELALKVKG